MAQYSKFVDLEFTSTGVAKSLILPFAPDQIEMWNKTKWATNTANLVKYAISWNDDAAGTAYAIIGDGSAHDNNFTLTSGGFTFFSAGTYAYGSIFTITGIVAATGVVTTSAPHGYAVGDTVLLYATTGELQIAGTLTTITAVPSTTTFTIGNIPTSGFAANATAGFVKKLLFPDLYLPNQVPISAITTGTTTTIGTAVTHNFVAGDEVGFNIPVTPYTNSTPVWGTFQLDSNYVLKNTGIPQQAIVTSVTNSTTFVVNVNSTGFGAFTYPTSAQAATGVQFPSVYAIGDQNSGGTLIPPLAMTPPAITIPGAFQANTRQGVIVGIGDGTRLMHQNNDVVRIRASLADGVYTGV